ncbi:MAG: heme peroxidase family protein [Bacteroidota bacterium]
MLRNINHLQGVKNGEEILYDTPFGYIFEYLCNNPLCRLPASCEVIDNLIELGSFMSDPANPLDEELDSNVPAVFTYLGQFIDHDVTARTDREERFKIADPSGDRRYFSPIDPDVVVSKLRNGRRPNLDLDAVFGDGPALFPGYKTQADDLYDPETLRMHLNHNKNTRYIDLPRNHETGQAIIADGRNDENIMISQIHAAFIAFYNRIHDRLPSGSPQECYSRARQLTTWAYQYIVLNDYLPSVCNEDVVAETLKNGPYYYGQFSLPFMPLEFSVAGFRFGHSMIRPSYTINGTLRNIKEVLGVSNPNNDFLDPARNFQLKPEHVIRWSEFNADNPARIIDSKIAKGLFELNNVSPSIPMGKILARLTQRNLLRGHLLSLPTGQSVAKAMRIFPLSEEQLQIGNSKEENQFLQGSGFLKTTPLWYYILKESEVQQKGLRLGVVGSKIVAETLIGLVKSDPNSYLNSNDAAIKKDGIDLPGIGKGAEIKNTERFLNYAQVS